MNLPLRNPAHANSLRRRYMYDGIVILLLALGK